MSDAPPPSPSEPPPQPQAPAAPAAPAGGGTNGLAIASLVMGILSIVCLGLLAGIPAVICGHMALGRIKASGQGGRGLAIVGLVLGYIGIVLTIIFLLMGGLAIIFGEPAHEGMLQEMERDMERMQESMPPADMPMPGEGSGM